MTRPVIIGIAGGTGSGKTTVANAIYERVGADRIEWISHDSYYRDFAHLSPEERSHLNFDHPDSLETEFLIRHLDELTSGRSIAVPIYDFTNHRRKPETTEAFPRPVIILEGILVLADRTLRDRIDIKLFVDTPPDIRFVRRLMRDTMSRGRSLESVVEQYLTTVRPMHEEFVEPSKRHADLIIPEGGENRVAIDAIISRVEALVSGGNRVPAG
ncbi:MAG TPA: uridine kinase [Thermoanaerobaculia bacterium]|nr:uridine kinase [Thermoanaerobaculia bacterium]